MIQVKHLTVFHKKDLRTIIEDLSFTIHPGDRAVVIGEEGNGKSTLLKLIQDETLVSDYIEYQGEIIKGTQKFGYLPQELPDKEKEKTVWEFCGECEGFYDITPKRLEEISMELGFPAGFFYSDQLVGTLSGGEKVKLQIARLLMSGSDCLLLDEPSNDIDLETLEWLEQFMNHSELPILYVSHDEWLIEHTANLILHLEQLRRKTAPKATIARMKYSSYQNERCEQIQKQEQLARKEKSEYDKKMEKYRKQEQKVEYRQRTQTRQDPHGGQLLKKKMHSLKSLEHRMERERKSLIQRPEEEESIFLAFSEKTQIPNGKTILDLHLKELAIEEKVLTGPIDLTVTGPQKICIIGKNGIGKSTLLKQIAKQLQKRSDINVAYMPQNYEELLDFRKTPVEVLTKTYEKAEQTQIRTYLGSMKYTVEEMEHPVEELSGGQKAKLLLLKMSLEGNNVLLLDEPTRNFSPLSNPVLRQVLKNYQGAIISVSHDRIFIEEISDRIYRLTEQGLSLIK